MKLSTVCFFIVIVFFTNNLKASEKEWATEWPPNLYKGKFSQELQFIEVPTSKLRSAISNLDKEIYQELTPTQLGYYTGKQAINYKSKYAILVRSVYMNGALGQFSVSKNQDDLWLRFYTFGTKSKFKKSALIVFVESLPRNIYITADTGKDRTSKKGKP